MLDFVVLYVDPIKTQEYEETMNDAMMKHVGDSKLMVMNETEKEEKDDHVKYKDYCINELNPDEADT